MTELSDIVVTRKISASAEELFDAWTDPHHPGGPWFGSKRAILNPVADGLFYHAVEHEGRIWPHYGRFIQLNRPHRIEHTWVSEATKGIETVVAITFESAGDAVEVTLRHSGTPDDEMGRRHKDGWTWVLSMLAERFESRTAEKSGR
ncbi:MAG: SRPBCC domain-containing protein [Terracidiphilus sp.]|jgi:uncharacterized protein YndB with AHSA1/START domain